MGDIYHFPQQFKCMYCKENLDPEGMLALPSDGDIDFKCPKCGAVWKFWVNVQLSHKLLKGGKYNKNHE